MTVDKGKIHVVIGDTQVKEGVPTKHLQWIGQYVVDQFAGQDIELIHLGDHWDMPSLCSFDKNKNRRVMEGLRVRKDLDAGNTGFDILNEPIYEYNKRRRRPWRFPKRYFRGNHDQRVQWAVDADPSLEGTISLDDMNPKDWGWDVYPFLEPVELDGVYYAHYFYNPKSGKPYGGTIDNRLKNIGHSFTMGHQQGFNIGNREVGNGRQWGMVLGTSYLHDERYLGPQGNNYWRGIVVCHQVEQGAYDPMCVSLEYLCRRYEGKTLKQFLK